MPPKVAAQPMKVMYSAFSRVNTRRRFTSRMMRKASPAHTAHTARLMPRVASIQPSVSVPLLQSIMASSRRNASASTPAPQVTARHIMTNSRSCFSSFSVNSVKRFSFIVHSSFVLYRQILFFLNLYRAAYHACASHQYEAQQIDEHHIFRIECHVVQDYTGDMLGQKIPDYHQ